MGTWWKSKTTSIRITNYIKGLKHCALDFWWRYGLNTFCAPFSFKDCGNGRNKYIRTEVCGEKVVWGNYLSLPEFHITFSSWLQLWHEKNVYFSFNVNLLQRECIFNCQCINSNIIPLHCLFTIVLLKIQTGICFCDKLIICQPISSWQLNFHFHIFCDWFHLMRIEPIKLKPDCKKCNYRGAVSL